ncbi:MAG TPA: glycerol kinase GlpK [Solirubrobacteraceae bacterium]|nr:glycerol kinase GlpK [Solirubrobacteraceae bacterium]
MSSYLAALDQGTTSTRLILFDEAARTVAVARREHAQILPRAGWVEHDPIEIWERAVEVIDEALAESGLAASDVAAIGITNQRETTVVWDRATGEPLYNAIVWQDTRTAALVRELAGEPGVDRLRERVGLPLSTYFSGPKIAWILEHVPGARERAVAGELAFGTIDSWIAWNLTGGVDGGAHITDVTNASRTLLMDLRTLDWHDESLELIGVPRAMLPEIRSSSEVYGEARVSALRGRPVAGIVGDQQAALLGQACIAAGEAKSTYGTGSFLLVNTGSEPIGSTTLLTSVAARIGSEPASYVLEGSIAVTGAAVQWLRDQIGLIDSAAAIEELALTVPDNGGVYFVPAFSGLFAPHWRPDARGAIVGLTAYARAGHLARATLEATAWQTRDVLDAMREDAGIELEELRVDGGMTANELLMQVQADVLGVPVVRPRVIETTALGAAFAAGLACGVLADAESLRERWHADRRWEPAIDADLREAEHARWTAAVARSLDWA